jgi:dihydrofolate reductase
MEAIYAIDSNNGLSKEGIIPWDCKKDMRFFMDKTKNNIVIMGKNTFFSLPEQHRPLKNRLNIILTHTPHLYENNDNTNNNNINVLFTNNDNIHESILSNPDKYYETYKFLHKDYKIFFIGGKTIYEKFIPLCNKVWVTQIKSNHNCDLFIDYDYSDQFTSKVYDEDDELKIIEYVHKE